MWAHTAIASIELIVVILQKEKGNSKLVKASRATLARHATPLQWKVTFNVTGSYKHAVSLLSTKGYPAAPKYGREVGLSQLSVLPP
jgi:hypothetical protein